MKNKLDAPAKAGFDTGALLKQIRGDKSQEEFAKMMGVGRTTVIRYESNQYTPDMDFLFALNMVYGLDPMYVVFGKVSAKSGLNEREIELITAYRNADAGGKQAIYLSAIAIAAQPPAPKPAPHVAVSGGIHQTSHAAGGVQVGLAMGQVNVKQKGKKKP